MRSRRKYFLFALMLVGLSLSCSTTEKKSEAGGGGGREPVSEKASEPPKTQGVDISGGFGTITNSLSNSALTSKTVSRAKIDGALTRVEAAAKAKDADRNTYIALMGARRLGRRPLSSVLEAAKDLMEIELRRKSDAEVPELARLEIALASVQNKKYSMAEHFLPELLKSQNRKIRAAALTLEGIIAADDGRIPEAVASWDAALKVDRDYEAAQLNLGFYALKFGDYKSAQQALGGRQSDWFAAGGLAVAERLSGSAPRATALCNRVLGAQPSNKLLLINCAINEWQSNLNFDKAKEMLDRATRSKGDQPKLDELAFRLIGKIDRDKASRAAEQRSQGAQKSDGKGS